MTFSKASKSNTFDVISTCLRRVGTVMSVTGILFAESTRVQISKAILFHLFKTPC